MKEPLVALPKSDECWARDFGPLSSIERVVAWRIHRDEGRARSDKASLWAKESLWRAKEVGRALPAITAVAIAIARAASAALAKKACPSSKAASAWFEAADDRLGEAFLANHEKFFIHWNGWRLEQAACKAASARGDKDLFEELYVEAADMAIRLAPPRLSRVDAIGSKAGAWLKANGKKEDDAGSLARLCVALESALAPIMFAPVMGLPALGELVSWTSRIMAPRGGAQKNDNAFLARHREESAALREARQIADAIDPIQSNGAREATRTHRL